MQIIEVTLSTPAALDALVSIRLAYLAMDAGKPLPPDVEQRVRTALPAYFIAHVGRDLFPFVAQDGDAFVASAFLQVIEKPSNPHFLKGRIGEVLNVCTLEPYRHKGLASAVMQALLAKAKALDLDYVYLDSTPQGKPLYQSLGFQDAPNTYAPMKHTLDA